MKILFLQVALALASATMAQADCRCPTIIEFGALDDPCRLSVLTDCDTCYRFEWFCDGMQIQDSNKWWNIAILGTHDYKIVVTDSCGCSDSASINAPDHGCTVTGFLETNETSSQESVVGYYDLLGQKLFFDDFRKKAFCGICIVIIRHENYFEARKIYVNK